MMGHELGCEEERRACAALGKALTGADPTTDHRRADAELMALLRTAFEKDGATGVYLIVVALLLPPQQAVRVPYLSTGNLFAQMFHDLVEQCWYMRGESASIKAALTVLADTRDMYSMDDLTVSNVVETVSKSFPVPKYGIDQVEACVQSVSLARKCGFIGRQLEECVGLLLAFALIMP
jgi:hypothetical protein